MLICEPCPYYGKGIDCENVLHTDAAAAIEELDAEETRLLLITSELQDKVVELEEELNDADIAADDNGRQVEELQAEIERLKDSNEELRERQTYIDHYGIEWLTSAKDVPNYAYEHGYADGMAEVKAQLPKRGKWIETEEEEWGIYPFKKQTCSVCDCKIDHTFMLACMDYFDDRDTVFHYCPNCGAKMTEVQE